MIIGKSLTALGGGGLKPEIRVTAKAGALLNLHYNNSSIILQSYQLGAEETQHTFVVNASETAYVIEDVTNSANVEVLVDAIAVFNVEIPYILWLYKDGDPCEDVTGGWTSQLVTGKGSVAKNVDNITITTVADGSPNATIVTANKIKQAVFSRYAKLCISYSETLDNKCRFGLSTVTGNDPAMVVDNYMSSNANYAELDLTSTTISGDCYVVVTAWGNYPNVNTVVVKQVWLE